MPNPHTFEFVPFRFTGLSRQIGRLLGVDPTTDGVRLAGDRLEVCFGPWTLGTDLDNVATVGLSSPCSVAQSIGPPRLRLRLNGFGFITAPIPAAELRFRTPIAGVDPVGFVKVSALVLTVDDADGLIEQFVGRGVARHDLVAQRVQQSAIDRLEGMTTKELRFLAREDGMRGTSKMNKSELVEAIEARHLPSELAEIVDAETSAAT